jgi:hypothetical protein
MLFGLTILSFATSGGDDVVAQVIGLVLVLLLVVTGFGFYFLPSLIAMFRNHHQSAAITVVNLFFGWTFLGWVVALAWSVSAVRER